MRNMLHSILPVKGFVYAASEVMWYIYLSESSILALVLHIHPPENGLFFCCWDVTKYVMCFLSLCVYVCVSTASLTAPANAQIVHSGAACNVKDDNISERIYTIKEGDTLVLQCIVKGHPRPQVSSPTTCWWAVTCTVHKCWSCYPQWLSLGEQVDSESLAQGHLSNKKWVCSGSEHGLAAIQDARLNQCIWVEHINWWTNRQIRPLQCLGLAYLDWGHIDNNMTCWFSCSQYGC